MGERLYDQPSTSSSETENGSSRKGVGMNAKIGAGGNSSPGQTIASTTKASHNRNNISPNAFRIPQLKQEFGNACGGICGWSCMRRAGGVLLMMMLLVLAVSALHMICVTFTLTTSTRRGVTGRDAQEPEGEIYGENVSGVRGRLSSGDMLQKMFVEEKHKVYEETPVLNETKHVSAGSINGLGDENQPQEEKHDEKETKRSSTAEVCDGYMKKYGIIPESSWGTAPLNIQNHWKTLKCDRVLAEDGFSLNDPPTGGKRRSIVLVWNKIAGWLSYQGPAFVKAARETCPTECVFTSDRSVLQESNGILFHGPTHSKVDFPVAKPPGARYVWVNLEPTTYAPVQNLLRDTHYMSKFDMTMTYERNSDIPLGYVGSNPASYYFNADKRPFKGKDGFGEPDAIAAFVSNCKAAGAPKRFMYIKELMKHATVHSFGGCLHNREEPVLAKANRQENKIAVLTHYKFVLAFENNNELRDYVTEKVYNGFQAGTLPVYWGASNIDDYVPKGSIIKASEFDSPADLARYLKKLTEDEEAYEAYFKWRDDPEEEKRFDEEVVARSAYSVNAMCRLCDRVLNQQ